MKTPVCSCSQSHAARALSLTTLPTCLLSAVLLLVPPAGRAAPDTQAGWTGGGGADQKWSTAANWTTTSPNLAPPANPMTQSVPGNGSGLIDHNSTIGSPGTSIENVDAPWTIGVLKATGRAFGMYGQDLTIQQATGGSTATLANGAIQIGNNTNPRVFNITNNIIFDDSAFLADPLNTSHAIVMRTGTTQPINFYGQVRKPSPNCSIDIRTTSDVNFYGGLSNNPSILDGGVGVAMMNDTATVNFYFTNNTWSFMSMDRGVVSIRTNDSLPTTSTLYAGSANTARFITIALNDFNQTLGSLLEDPTVGTSRTLTTGVGAGGTLTLNNNAVTNDWMSMVMSGPGRLVLNGNGKLTFWKTHTYTGGTTINNGILQLGVGGAGGLLAGSGNITNNATLIINSTDAFTLAGNLLGTGSLQKLAANTVTFNGITSYSGNTYVGGGNLTVGASGNLSPSPTITLSGGATLDVSATSGLTRSSGQTLNGDGNILGTVTAQPGSTVTVGNSPGTLTVGTLNLDTTTLNMELSSDPTTIGGGVNDFIAVTNTLSLANVSTINVTPLDALNTATPYKIIQYGALSGVPANLTATLPYPGRYGFTVQDAPGSPGYIQLAVASSLVNGYQFWAGGDSGDPTRWDVTTTNWLNGASPDKFMANDPVAFDDSAVTNRATLTGSLVALSLVASNNSLGYTLDGSGSLTLTTLKMQGGGAFTIANSAANSLGNVTVNNGIFTLANSAADSLGNVLANGGTLTFANTGADTFTRLTANGGNVVLSNGAPNSFGPIAVTNGSVTIANNAANTFSSLVAAGGTLAFNQPTNVSVTTAIVGAGGVAKNGTNRLTLAADNLGYTGNLQINNGILRASANNALGDGNAIIASGATLDLNFPVGTPQASALALWAADVTVQGPGVGGQGAIICTDAYQAWALRKITLAGDTTFGGNWETIGGTFVGGGYKITKVGAGASIGDLFIESASSDPDFGDIEIQQGLFGIENVTTLGRPANTITVRSNAILCFYRCPTAGDKQIVLDDGALLSGGGGVNGGSAFGGTMSLNGTNHVVWYSASSLLTYNGTMYGTGAISVDATPGTFILGGTNIHTGGTFVRNGALRLTNSLALSSNLTVVVTTNGISGSGQVFGNNVPRVELSDSVVIPPGVTMYLNSDNAVGCRTSFGVRTATTNEYQGRIIPNGDGYIPLFVSNNSVLTISGPITNLDFGGILGLRSGSSAVGNSCTISGRISINGEMQANSAATYKISSTGNQWRLSSQYGPGLLVLGANDALCVTAPLLMASSGSLDLAGFNQTVSSITNDPASPATGVIGNSSTTADSVFTLNGSTNVSTISNSIVNVVGSGTRKVALTITNTIVRLFGTNTYTGPTLVKNGGILGGTGKLASAVTVESGGSLAPGASIGTLTITSNLVLSAGSSNVFEVNIDTLAHDMVVGLSNVTYGGTLVIVSNGGFGAAITNGASIKLLNALTYSGAFAAIVPAVPAPGFEWNTNALTTTGTLAIKFAPSAVNDTVARAAGTPLKILKSALLGNDIGTPLSVQSTDALSTNNAAITTDATFVYYNPPSLNPVHNVTDRFNYTITDGVFTSVGTVIVTILPAPTNATHNITGISTNGDGNYTISFAGIPGQTYVVEATTNIVTPAWTPINTNIAGTNGLWNFTDLEATNYPSRFYRTATP